MSTSFHSDEVTSATSAAETPTLKPDDYTNTQDGSIEPGTTRLAAGGMLQPFKVRNFNLLFGGQTISILGDALYMVALPWLVLTTGGNAQELGIVLTTYGIPLAAS